MDDYYLLEQEGHSHAWRGLAIFAVINATMGVACLEYAWYRTRRYRNPIVELNAQFPELCRHDAPYWQKWKQYPGAMTVLLPRFVLLVCLILLMTLLLKLCMCGYDPSRPLRGVRKFLCRYTLQMNIKLCGIFGWWTHFDHQYLTLNHVNHYEEYLGPRQSQEKYQEFDTPAHPQVPKRGKGPSPTVVCNHSGYMEILCIIASPFCPGFTPKMPIKDVPIVSGIAKALQSLYVERTGSREERDKLVQSFIDRQDSVEVQNSGLSPLSIFPESTTTNGSRLLPFKRGAFQGMRTVSPCIYTIGSGQIRPTYESMDFLPLLILMLSSLTCQRAKLTILPDFTPTPWMLQHHADKDPDGTAEPWKIYAWCVRDVISKYGGIQPLDERCCLQDRLNFYKLMSCQIDSAEINGQKFSYEGDEPDQSLVISQPSQIRRKSTVTYFVDSESMKPGHMVQPCEMESQSALTNNMQLSFRMSVLDSYDSDQEDSFRAMP